MIETLTLFITLAECLHFRKASERHHITPAALTRAIQTLEQSLGVRLFDRNNRSVRITESGKRFYKFAKETCLAYEQLITELQPQTLKGSIKLYATVTAAYSILPDLIKAFRITYPFVTTYLETGAAKGGFSRVLSGESDFCIGIVPKQWPPGLICKKILQTPLIGVIPKSVSEFEIEHLSLIFPEQGELSKQISSYLETQKRAITIHSYVEGHEAILAMVAAGLGMAILPKIVIENSHLNEAVTCINMQGLPLLEVGIFAKKTALQSPIKEAFWISIQST